MTTREQALAALEELEELAVCGHNENAASRHTIRAIARIVRDYLAQPEGGDVEDEIAYGHFEVKEEDGRHFWFGAEDGWKDSDEIGEDGVLTIDAKHFAVGTVLAMSEPVSASTSRSALRSAKEREAAAVERTVEKAMRERDAEIRRDTIEKAKDLLRNAARDDGDSPRETLTQYLSGYRDGRQSCSARVVAALDSLRDGKE